MNTRILTTYGPGGFDPNDPSGNVVAEETLEASDPLPKPPTAEEFAALTDAVESLTASFLLGGV